MMGNVLNCCWRNLATNDRVVYINDIVFCSLSLQFTFFPSYRGRQLLCLITGDQLESRTCTGRLGGDKRGGVPKGDFISLYIPWCSTLITKYVHYLKYI